MAENRLSPLADGPMSIDPKLDKKRNDLLAESIKMQVKAADRQTEGASLLLKNESAKSAAVDTIDSSELSTIQKSKLKENIVLSPTKVTDSIARGNTSQAGLSDKFMSSMTAFLPEIIGTVGGALLGGTRAAIAGGEAGRRIQKTARSIEQQKFEQQLAKEKMGQQEMLQKDRQAFIKSEREARQKFETAEREKTLSARQALEKFKAANKEKKPLTESQAKARLFGTRAAQAEKVFEQLEKEKFDPSRTRLRASRLLPKEAQSAELQRFDQASLNFLNSILRKESGAVISEEELAKGKEQYFPVPGDKPAVIAQKKKNRQLAIKLLAEEGQVDLKKFSSEMEAAPTAQIRRRTKDGKIAIFDKDKKFLRFE